MKKKKRPTGVIISKKKEFHVHVDAPNGNILMSSETFKRKQSALKNVLATAKVFADVLSGKTGVTDEQGHTWVLQKDGQFKNTTRYLRKELLPVLRGAIKSIGKANKAIQSVTGKNVVVKKSANK